jgi:transposase, IS5 family
VRAGRPRQSRLPGLLSDRRRTGPRRQDPHSARATPGRPVLKQVLARLAHVARERRVIQGRRLRVDTTVVETHIHYPTDSTLLADGVRMLTRTLKRLGPRLTTPSLRIRDRAPQRQPARLRDRAPHPHGDAAHEAGRAGAKQGSDETALPGTHGDHPRGGPSSRDCRGPGALAGAGRGEAPRRAASHDPGLGAPRPRPDAGPGASGRYALSRQSTEPVGAHTEAIRKGKAVKPAEFGKLVKIQEAEAQFITDYAVCPTRVSDGTLWGPSLVRHEEIFGRPPRLAVADAAFASAANIELARTHQVQSIVLPRQRRERRPRAVRAALRWRTGSEGRISALKRRHGLARCRYHGLLGMERWVGLGVIANNLLVLGRASLRAT